MKPSDTSGTNVHRTLQRQIALALVLGVAGGLAINKLAPDAEAAKGIAAKFSLLTDVFLHLIKMVIAPLVFASIASGIAKSGSTGSVGRLAFRSLAWFLCASVLSLSLGMALANLFEPGRGTGLTLPSRSALKVETSSISAESLLAHVFPTSIVEAMASNQTLQILVFASFFGCALASSTSSKTTNLTNGLGELVHVMLRITNYVMRIAPIGVFGAAAAAVTMQGVSIIISYGRLLLSYYFGLGVLWLVLGGVGWLMLRRRLLPLLSLLREPMLIAFSTASSEAAFPKMIESLEKFGVHERIAGFVLPLGYSFNLDGSMMYAAFASLFIAQAYGIQMSLGQQSMMLLVMLLTSKGIAGVPRASLVVVAATLPLFNLPAEGVLLIVGIDQIMDMGRSVTNVIGNGMATAIVAMWEGELRPARSDSFP